MITFRRLGRFGNIGNSLFQYSTLLGVGDRTGYNVLIPKHKTYYENDYENYNHSIFDGFDITTPILEKDSTVYTFEYNGMEYKPNIFDIEDNTNLHGYFQSEKYFSFCRHVILKNLKFKDNIIKDSNKLFNSLDIEPQETTSIHVRRGDFLKKTSHHPIQPPEYYKEAIKNTTNKNYLFFSDDIEWCKRTYSKNKNVYFSENTNPFVDLYSMSKCKHNIIVNSSFSWWAAWLNTNSNKRVVAPNNWFGKAYSNFTTKDVIPQNWIKI